ncbi:MAG: NAD(P)H-dependent glycerol-3-phosphate dehydrogenase [Candidatus Saccharimonadales bacterium]
MNVSIMGAGAYGTALGKILIDNGHNVSYFDPKRSALTLEGATKTAEAVIIAIPADATAELCKDYPTTLKSLPTILATKGLTDASIFGTFEHFSVLSGPAFADDLLTGKAAVLTATDEISKTLFENEQVDIEVTDDLRGVILCGALKNVYAIGAGYQDPVASVSAAWLTRAYREMRQYLSDHDANANTCNLACGIGDLVMTCSSESSRNFLCGRMIKKGIPLNEIRSKLGTIEGITALDTVDRQNYPLISGVYALINR